MVQHESLDNQQFARMIQLGQRELAVHKDEINALNVFPVPDGDTGTNMTLSFTAGLEQVLNLGPDARLDQLTAALSAGLLMGARGNSGVILSQLCRGFQIAFGHQSQVDAKLFAKALTVGVQTAYKAVTRPVEGTILTVAREAAQAAEAACKRPSVSLSQVLAAALSAARQALARTPEQLPVLRQAGVVDSGGQGFVHLLEGFCVAFEQPGVVAPFASMDTLPTSTPAALIAAQEIHGEGEYGYCTEMLIRTVDRRRADTEQDVRRAMEVWGDSLLVVAVEDPASTGYLVKVHVHTEHPGSALEAGLTFGELIKIKIDNMTEQSQLARFGARHASLQDDPEATSPARTAGETKPALCGLIAVVAGDGIAEVFRGLAVDVVIACREGMNPSTEEIIQALGAVAAERVFVLPNHPNVIMAAQQAARVSQDRLVVLPTKSIGAGLGAALAFSPEKSMAQNEALMRTASARIRSAAVSVASRDAQMDGKDIVKGAFIGVIDGVIQVVDSTRQGALQAVLDRLCGQGAELCTVFCARSEDAAEADVAARMVQAQFPGVEFEIQYGGQPVYDFILAAE